MNDLAKAQQCMDRVVDSAPDTALNCYELIASYDSQQANIIKCSAYLTAGGLTTSKLKEAYKTLDTDDSSLAVSKESVFMGALALNNPNATEGLARAKAANGFCIRSGIKGLRYISDLALIGSQLSELAGGFALPPTAGEISTAITNCRADAATCAAVLGPSTAALADGYCATSDPDEKICSVVNNVNNVADSNEALTEALLCAFEKKTYSNGTCI